jgi:hypothetical protein
VAAVTPPPPRTWAFINRYNGDPMAYTCLTGCTNDHALDIATPTFPSDIFCETTESTVTLPMNTGRAIEELRVMGVALRVDPFSRTIAERLPFADFAITDDIVIEGLDPDGLATVLNTIAARLGSLWETHGRLVQLRAEYMQRQVA